MKVFISWSGERSKQIAVALKPFLSDVIQSVQCFMSEADIAAGSNWSTRLLQELESTNFGILCLTPENAGAAWPLFEAGALAKSIVNARVCPYLFGLAKTDVQWPLAQFQASLVDEDGTRAIVNSINRSMDVAKLDEQTLERAFTRCWPEYQTKLSAIPRTVPDQPPRRPIEDYLEEILRAVRPGSRPQPGGDRPKAVIADVAGGFLEGRRFGNTQEPMASPFDPAAWAALTDGGTVGKRFRTLHPALVAMLAAGRTAAFEALRDELGDNASGKYEIVDRFEDDLVIYLRMRHVPDAPKTEAEPTANK